MSDASLQEDLGINPNFEDWQKRVIQELYDLNLKIHKLKLFLKEHSDEVRTAEDPTSFFLLREQLEAMQVYSAILQRRVERIEMEYENQELDRQFEEA